MKQSAVVIEQFGHTAQAYVTSAVHASGADLQALRELVDHAGKPSVLDLGCGAGHASFAVAPGASAVTAYDLSARMLEVVARGASERQLANLTTRQGRAEQLPFADASFDLVVTRFSAHHWMDVPAALQEVQRVLRPGGKLVVIDIVAPAIPLYDTTLQAVELLRDASHVRDYRLAEWLAMLGQAGLAARHQHSWKLVMQFDEWSARMRTPPERMAAIRSLFDSAPEEAAAYFAVQDDYSFAIDSAWLEAVKPD